MSLPYCLWRVSFRRHSPVSLEVVKIPNKCQSLFGHNFLGGTTQTFLRYVVSARYRPPCGKIWLSPVCWSPSAKRVNKVNCRIYVGWVKCRSNFEPFVDRSSLHFERMQKTPCSFQCTYPIMYIVFHSVDIGR